MASELYPLSLHDALPILADHADFGGLAEHAYGCARSVVGFVEKFALGQVQAVNDRIGWPHAEELRKVARGFRQHTRRMQGTARRDGFQRFNVRLEDAHVTRGKPRR